MLRTRIHLRCSLLFFVCICFVPSSKASVSLAVLPFIERNEIDDTNAGEMLADAFLQELVDNRLDLVVKRAELSLIEREQKLQRTGLIDPESGVRVGALLETDHFVLGTIQRLRNQFYITIKLVESKGGTVLRSSDLLARDLLVLPDEFFLIARRVASDVAQGNGDKVISATLGVKKRERRIIAVLPFDVRTDLPEENAGRTIADWLVASLAELNQDDVVERMDLSKLVGEIKLQSTGIIDPNTAVKVGKIKGAAFLVMGSIEVWQGKIIIAAKLVEVESGLIVRTERYDALSIDDVPATVPSIAKFLTLTLEERQRYLDRIDAIQTRLSIAATLRVQPFVRISSTSSVHVDLSLTIDGQEVTQKAVETQDGVMDFPRLLNLSLPPGKHRLVCRLRLRYLQREMDTFKVGKITLPVFRNEQILYHGVEKEVKNEEAIEFDAFRRYSKNVKISIRTEEKRTEANRRYTFYVPIIEIVHEGLFEEYRAIVRRTIPHVNDSFVRYIYERSLDERDFLVTDHVTRRRYRVTVLPDRLISLIEVE